MFEALPNARATLAPGAVYAVTGRAEWIYYAQVATDKSVGFLRFRSRELASPDDFLALPVMSRFGVAYPSIGRAVRSGVWKYLGRHPVHIDLRSARPTVQWPQGTLKVSVWEGASVIYETTVDDSRIQDLEVIAAWDAEAHVPGRLQVDFGDEIPDELIGGTVFRERKLKELRARKFVDQPWHLLPAGWVHT